MRKRWFWLGGAALAALTGLAIAQPVVTQNLSGNEGVLFQVGGPGGGSGITNIAVIRNSTGYQLVATGGTVNTTVANTVAKVLATGAITTWNVTLPTAPFDGQMVEVACPGGTSTVAMTATLPAGVTIVGTAFTACTSGGAAAVTAGWIYSSSANVWYRFQ